MLHNQNRLRNWKYFDRIRHGADGSSKEAWGRCLFGYYPEGVRDIEYRVLYKARVVIVTDRR